jgi:hypothetical protein
MPRNEGSVNISRTISNYIDEMAVTSPEDSPQEILDKALRFALRKEDDTLRADQIHAVTRRVRRARQKLTDEDEQWSLGGNPDLLERLVPPSARIDVLDVAFWHLIGQTKFTFRQAKWVGRLRCSFADDDDDRYSYMLAHYSSYFAREELGSMVLGRPFDSSFWDLFLARTARRDLDAYSHEQLMSYFDLSNARFKSDELSEIFAALRLNRVAIGIPVLDQLSGRIAQLCPELPASGSKMPVVVDRKLFELVVLRLRRTGSEEFLSTSDQEQRNLVTKLYALASKTPLPEEEWPERWDERDDASKN